MKYCLVVLLLASATQAAPTNEKEIVKPAQFGMGPYNSYYSPNSFHSYPQYSMGMYKNPLQFGSAPDQEHYGPLNPDKYLNMKDEDFPMDYSLPCSNTCGCRQACMIVWWQPCTCRCPPPCGCVGCNWGCCKDRCCEDTTTTEQVPVPEPEPEPEPRPEPDPKDPEDCNGGSCCNSCSCMPCMMPIFWMCPPRCGGGCCSGGGGDGGGGSSCCNSSNRSCCGK